MRRRYYVIAVLLAIAGYAIGSMILPRGGELALIYYKAGHYETARSILERQLGPRRVTPSEAYYASNTYLKLGETDKAAAVVRRYLAEHPEDMTARLMLGRLYAEAGKPALYIHNLESVERHAPSAKNRIALARLYYENGYYKRWERMIRRLVSNNEAAPKDYLALAKLDAAGKRMKAAAGHLMLLKQRRPRAFGKEAVRLLAVLYLDLKQPKPALREAAAWLRKNKRLDDALDFAARFRDTGRPELALTLLAPHEGRVANVPDLLDALTELEIAAGKPAQALQRLQRLSARSQLSPEQMELLIETAIAAGDWPAAADAFAKAEIALLKPNTISHLIAEAASRNDAAFGAKLAGRLPERYRRSDPVAAATLALLVGERGEAAKWAVAATREASLTREQRIGLITVLVGLNDDRLAAMQLKTLVKAGGLPDYIVVRLAAALRRFGMEKDGRAMLARLAASRSSPWIDAGRLLLAPRAKGARPNFAWLDKRENLARKTRLDVLTGLYGGAIAVKDYDLAAETATRLLALDNTQTNRLRQARALALSGQAGRAFTLLGPELKRDPGALGAYAEAMVGAVKTRRISTAKARGFLRDYMRNRNVPLARRRSIIYDLLAIKAHDVVLPVMRGLSATEGPTFSALYLEALLSAGRKADFNKVIAAQIAGARSPEWLAKLGKLAFQESAYDSARVAYRKVRRARPNDRNALRHLGLIASFKGEAHTARQLLTAYLKSGAAADYKVEYALGEAINRTPDWRLATPHFLRALRLIEKLKQPTVEDLSMKAHMLHRTGRFDAAAKVYERLIRVKPRDRALRNRYIDFLIETGRYERARQLQRQS